jgi:hydroxymethylglutaryl-CoA lyase
VNFGVHLHATPDGWEGKLAAAIEAGCRRVDGALKGIGGCPMAGNALVGNMNTENILFYLEERNLVPAINQEALKESLALASTIFAT